MSAGYPKDKANVDSIAGTLAREVNRLMRMADQFKTELDAYNDASLTGLGYTAGEVTQLRTAAADLSQLATVYRGGANLAVAKDFRASVRPLWGVLGDY